MRNPVEHDNDWDPLKYIIIAALLGFCTGAGLLGLAYLITVGAQELFS